MNRIRDAFSRVKADDALIDGTVDFLRKERLRRSGQSSARAAMYRRAAALVAAVVALAGLGGGFALYRLPVSYISIDINPSLELSLNRFDRVVAAEAYNDDGEGLLSAVRMKGLTYTDAIDSLLSSEELASCIGEDGEVVFTVISPGEERIISGIESCGGYELLNGSCHTAGAETREAAHGCHMSFGKYRAYEELAQYDPSVTAEDCRDMTMHQIHCLIEGHREEHGAADGESESGASGAETHHDHGGETCHDGGHHD